MAAWSAHAQSLRASPPGAGRHGGSWDGGDERCCAFRCELMRGSLARLPNDPRCTGPFAPDARLGVKSLGRCRSPDLAMEGSSTTAPICNPNRSGRAESVNAVRERRCPPLNNPDDERLHQPFSQGLPGAMNRVFTPTMSSQRRTACAVSSGSWRVPPPRAGIRVQDLRAQGGISHVVANP